MRTELSSSSRSTPSSPTSREAPAAWHPVTAPRTMEWDRYRDVLRRFKWLILGVSMVGVAAAAAVIRFMAPVYAVQATIWISTETPQSRGGGGPMRADELLTGTAWTELLRSYAVLDNVVRERRLALSFTNPSDTAVFRGFTFAEVFRPGAYELRVAAETPTYALMSGGRLVEQGRLGDSIGSKIGFRWQPAAESLGHDRSIEFTLKTPREVAVELRDRLDIALPRESNLMRVQLFGPNADAEAAILNSVVRGFVDTASSLKRRNHTEFARTLQQQVQYAEAELRAAEMALESFRVTTITLPAEGSPVAAGLELTRDPVMASYFAQKVERDDIAADVTLLGQMLADMRRGGDPVLLWSVPAVQAAPDLRAAIDEYVKSSAALRERRAVYTDAHTSVRTLDAQVHRLRQEVIPQQVGQLITALSQRGTQLEHRISGASTEIREIPRRTIEEMRLRRNVEVRTTLYTTLKNRFEEARLAESSAIPDVRILDRATAPQMPLPKQSARVLLLGLIGGLGAAGGLALLLDRTDRRFRYPSQVTDGLNLPVLGAIPSMGKGKTAAEPEQAAQVIEAFRSIRLALRQGAPPKAPLAVTISSAGKGEGKSLVAANLALAFAAAGERTILVDGDVRLGSLHSTFDLDRRLGLTDFLAGRASLATVIKPTGYDRLSVLPSGSRMRRGPEMLTSPLLRTLLDELAREYDAVIVDSAPLSAGVDAFAIATGTKNLVLVFRGGHTDRHLAESKLELVDRLPIAVVGAVINDVETMGTYRYYAYAEGYSAWEEDEAREPGSALTVTR